MFELNKSNKSSDEESENKTIVDPQQGSENKPNIELKNVDANECNNGDEVPLEQLDQILSTTIKHDKATKIDTFLGSLLTYTEDDQMNITFRGESSSGKSYIATEIAEYFPKEDVITLGHISPTALYYDHGILVDDNNKPIDFSKRPSINASPLEKQVWSEKLAKARKYVDWSKKIIIFLEQPNDRLLKGIRSFLSHDARDIEMKVTDREKNSGYRTKTMVLHGFATVIFCTAKSQFEDQESTRMLVLSPESSQEKLKDALELIAMKNSDPEFKQRINENPLRIALMKHIKAIKDEKFTKILVENRQEIIARFSASRPFLKPRNQRDFPRMLGLIKAWALLNNNNRKTENRGNEKILWANETDIEVGFKLYDEIAESNELGISPEVYTIFKEAIKPNITEKGLLLRDIHRLYTQKYGRNISDKRLRYDVIPALIGTGLIREESDIDDRRKMRYFLN